jgi:hypothetical protein
MKRRIALTATGIAFGLWETIDIFRIDVPAIAVVFAIGFLASATWFWKRDSGRAASCLLVLFAIEAAVAPSLKHTATVTKAAAFSLGLAGVIAAITVLATRRRTRRLPAVTA